MKVDCRDWVGEKLVHPLVGVMRSRMVRFSSIAGRLIPQPALQSAVDGEQGSKGAPFTGHIGDRHAGIDQQGLHRFFEPCELNYVVENVVLEYTARRDDDIFASHAWWWRSCWLHTKAQLTRPTRYN